MPPDDGAAHDVSKAVVVFLAFGCASWPQADEVSLAREFGVERALALRAKVDALRSEMGAIEIRLDHAFPCCGR